MAGNNLGVDKSSIVENMGLNKIPKNNFDMDKAKMILNEMQEEVDKKGKKFKQQALTAIEEIRKKVDSRKINDLDALKNEIDNNVFIKNCFKSIGTFDISKKLKNYK